MSPTNDDLEAAAVIQENIAAGAQATAIDLRSWKVVTPPPPTPSGLTDLGPFKLARAEYFNQDAPEGQFLATYPHFGAYPSPWTDTSRHGTYDPSRLSVSGGFLKIHVDTRNGKPGGAVPYFKGDNGADQFDQTYGRYEFRVQADPVARYKVAFLLWSKTNQWSDGEIDILEGNLNGMAKAFNHIPDSPKQNDPPNGLDYGTRLSDWNTYACEWTPGKVEFFTNGRSVGSSSKAPSKPMHLVLQTETELSNIAPSVSNNGYVNVDYVAAWFYKP